MQEQGFNSSGEPVELTADSCAYVLSQHAGRPLFYQKRVRGINTGSMYDFGGIACSGIQSGFDWTAVLSRIESPATTECQELKLKLMAKRDEIDHFIRDEITPAGISEQTFEQLAELYSRLFPSYGHFDDKWNFLSDNFYSFEPSWNFKGYHTAPDFRTMVEEAFGSYRKDLARVVAATDGSTISLLSNFRDSITVEQMIDMLSLDLPNSNGWGFIGTTFDGALADLTAFDRLPGKLRAKLVEDLLFRLQADGDDGFMIAGVVGDTLTMLESIPDGEMKRFRSDKSWDQVHGRAVTLASDDKIESLDPVYFPHELTELDGVELSGRMALKLLRTPLDFLRAGSQSGLNNCMGKAGYYTKAKAGESYCFVGHSESELTAGIEIRKEENSWVVLQFNGRSNRVIDGGDELKEELLIRLNGSSPKPRTVAKDSTENLELQLGHLEVLEVVEDGPILQQIALGEVQNEPVDIPPLEMLTQQDLEQTYIFGGLDQGEEAPIPRILTLADFHERVNGHRQHEHFAYPLGN